MICQTGSVTERLFLSSLQTLWMKRERASASEHSELLPLCQKVQEGTTQQVSDAQILETKVSVKSKIFFFF